MIIHSFSGQNWMEKKRSKLKLNIKTEFRSTATQKPATTKKIKGAAIKAATTTTTTRENRINRTIAIKMIDFYWTHCEIYSALKSVDCCCAFYCWCYCRCCRIHCRCRRRRRCCWFSLDFCYLFIYFLFGVIFHSQKQDRAEEEKPPMFVLCSEAWLDQSMYGWNVFVYF